MSRAIWLNDGLVAHEWATLPIDDPAVRHGAGLFETMRAQDGAIPWLQRHLDRLESSARTLHLEGIPHPASIHRAARAVAAALGDGVARIRVTATPHPTLIVDGAHINDAVETMTAVSVRGAWHPGRTVAEHKTLSFLEWRHAHERATVAGADLALLLDAGGRLGEASVANVFCVIGGALVTAPVDGLLAGIARAAIFALRPAREEALDESAWRAADEMFATNAFRGVVPIVRCDGRPIGDGSVGPVTSELRRQIGETLIP